MGIDLKSGGRRVGHNVRTTPVSKNPYLKLLERLFSLLRLSIFWTRNASCFVCGLEWTAQDCIDWPGHFQSTTWLVSSSTVFVIHFFRPWPQQRSRPMVDHAVVRVSDCAGADRCWAVDASSAAEVTPSLP
eukprot:gene20349-24269_t